MKGRPTRGTTAGTRYLALRKHAKALGRPTAELLQLYALEGFLARLERSEHRSRLVLKGGVLLAAFDLRRPTRDIDFLALQVDNDPAAVGTLIADVAAVDVDDGLEFLVETRWRDFADLHLMIDADPSDAQQVVPSIAAVARHRGVPLAPLRVVLAGMPERAQARWTSWLEQQGLADRVPRSFQELLDRLDQATQPWITAAAATDSNSEDGG